MSGEASFDVAKLRPAPEQDTLRTMETEHSSDSHARLDWKAAREHFKSVDPGLLALAIRFPSPAMSRPRSTFESLSHAIIGQQLSVKAAATIWNRVLDHHGGLVSAQGVLNTPQDQHRSLGVSRQKHGYLCSLADAYLASPAYFDDVETWSDEDIVAAWTQVKGLGRWTVQMHLMFQLGRPDVFPVDDLGIRRAMEAHFGIPKDAPKSTYEKRALVWSPFRTAACRVLWMSLDNQPK